MGQTTDAIIKSLLNAGFYPSKQVDDIIESHIKPLELALLNIDGTARRWAIANGGDTPLAILATMAREALGLNIEEADKRIHEINATKEGSADDQP